MKSPTAALEEAVRRTEEGTRPVFNGRVQRCVSLSFPFFLYIVSGRLEDEHSSLTFASGA